MQNPRNVTPLLQLFFCLMMGALMIGCAGTKKVAKAPHPLAGTWTYSLDTPQGVYTGLMTFAEVENMLSGTIISDDQPDQTAILEELSFDAEMSQVKFHFDGGEYGKMTVNTVLEGDMLEGMMNVGAYNVDVKLSASRKMP